jgi:hypothetical protein
MAFVQKLPATTVHNTGFTHKAVIKAADITGLTKATGYGLFPAYRNTAITFPAGSIVEKIHVNVNTVGTNGANTLTLSVGDGNSATRFVNALDLKTVTQSVGASIAACPFVYSTADSIDFQIGTDASDLTAVGALDMEIYIRVINCTELELDSGPLGT